MTDFVDDHDADEEAALDKAAEEAARDSSKGSATEPVDITALSNRSLYGKAK